MLEIESARLQMVHEYAEIKARFISLGQQLEFLIRDARNVYQSLNGNPDFTDEDRAEVLAFRDKVKTRLNEISDSL